MGVIPLNLSNPLCYNVFVSFVVEFGISITQYLLSRDLVVNAPGFIDGIVYLHPNSRSDWRVCNNPYFIIH